jgi:integrase
VRRVGECDVAYAAPLRHTFASIAASLGFSELTISRLLGHGPRGATQRYVQLDVALVIAADQVSAEIARMFDGGEIMSPRNEASS